MRRRHAAAAPSAQRRRARRRRRPRSSASSSSTRSASSLSQERDINRLLETILVAAKTITQRRRRHALPRDRGAARSRFEIVRNDIARASPWAAPPATPMPFYPIHAVRARTASPTTRMVAAYAALTTRRSTSPTPTPRRASTSPARANFDKKTGYRSKSFLTVPMKNHENEIIGVLQLHQRQGPGDRRGRARSPTPTSASPNRSPRRRRSRSPTGMLINQLEELFESFIDLINTAIDDKSPYTGGHCQRVPMLTMMLAEAVERHATSARSPTSRMTRARTATSSRSRACCTTAARSPRRCTWSTRRPSCRRIFDRIELDRHALRGAQARRRDRAAARRRLDALGHDDDASAAPRRASACAARLRRDRRRPRVPAPHATSAASACGRRTRSA